VANLAAKHRQNARLPAHVPPAMTAAGLALMGASMALELPSALVRLVAASVILGAFHRLGAGTDTIAALLAFGPLLRCIAALAVPLPAPLLVRAASGARKPSDREHVALRNALALLPGVREPRRVLVVDSPDENAWVLGETLFISRGLFDGPHLVAVVAHEAAHLAAGDGRLALAAWWLPVRWMSWLAQRLLGVDEPGLLRPRGALPQPHAAPPASPAYGTPGYGTPGYGTPGYGPPGYGPPGPAMPGRGGGRSLIGRLARLPGVVLGAGLLLGAGGLFPMLLRPLWARHRRSRELAADAYAARLGQAPGLIEALAEWQLLDLAQPWWQGRSHPYVEQRIDALQAFMHGRL
jgi:Zn-dependent protease with chaperone function